MSKSLQELENDFAAVYAAWNEARGRDSDRSPRWHVWLHVPTVSVLEAVALSLNQDPSNERIGRPWESDYFDRLEVAQRNFPESGRLPLPEFVTWARSIGWDMPPELDTIEPPRPSGKWPWGEYETELLRLLDAAARRFWVNYDPGDPSSAPTSSEVMAWLKEQKADISSRETEAIAKILRADGLPMGRRG